MGWVYQQQFRARCPLQNAQRKKARDRSVAVVNQSRGNGRDCDMLVETTVRSSLWGVVFIANSTKSNKSTSPTAVEVNIFTRECCHPHNASMCKGVQLGVKQCQRRTPGRKRCDRHYSRVRGTFQSADRRRLWPGTYHRDI